MSREPGSPAASFATSVFGPGSPSQSIASRTLVPICPTPIGVACTERAVSGFPADRSAAVSHSGVSSSIRSIGGGGSPYIAHRRLPRGSPMGHHLTSTLPHRETPDGTIPPTASRHRYPTPDQERHAAMDQLNELGFYVLAGAPAVARRAARRGRRRPRRSGSAPRSSPSASTSRRRSRSRARSARCRRRSASRPPPPTTTRATRSSPRRTRRRCTGLTGGRFTLGLGRGIAPLFDAYGIPRITTAQIEDFVGLMRRLWQGEVDLRPRRPGREVPRAAPRRVVRRGHPARLRGVRPELARARGPRASTWWCCTRSSPTRPSSAASRTVRARRRAGRPRSRRRCASGRATRPSATTSPRRCG